MAKTVFITGASSGFGRACAELFASQQYQLILLARRAERLEELAKSLSVATHILPIDISATDALEKAIADLPASFQDIDILLNNAGCALGMDAAPVADLQNWQKMVDVNITGLIACTRLLLPNMIKRKQGHIINVGSVAGDWPYPGGNVYGATKAFVAQFSRNLRCDCLGEGVRVSNIAPGLAETDFSLVRFNGNAEKAQQVYEGYQPLAANDIAEIVLWISQQPSHVNINHIEVMPTAQTWGPFNIAKQK